MNNESRRMNRGQCGSYAPALAGCAYEDANSTLKIPRGDSSVAAPIEFSPTDGSHASTRESRISPRQARIFALAGMGESPLLQQGERVLSGRAAKATEFFAALSRGIVRAHQQGGAKAPSQNKCNLPADSSRGSSQLKSGTSTDSECKLSRAKLERVPLLGA